MLSVVIRSIILSTVMLAVVGTEWVPDERTGWAAWPELEPEAEGTTFLFLSMASRRRFSRFSRWLIQSFW